LCVLKKFLQYSSFIFRLGVWSGEIEFDNLELKPSALEDLHLPITVTRGFVKKIRVEIPWASLTTRPVKVLIEGIYLQASPLDVTSKTPEELRAHALYGKQKTLSELESSITDPVMKKSEEPEGASKSFGCVHDLIAFLHYFYYFLYMYAVQILVEKILDNLEVSIQNIHIRYHLFVHTCIYDMR